MREGGDEDEDGTGVDSGAGADQGEIGCLAARRHHSQRVYPAFAGGSFQTGSDREPERTVSNGASGEKRRGLLSKADSTGKPVWYVRLYHDGRERRFGSFSTKTKAREFYEKAKLEQKEGRFFPERYQVGGYAKLAEVLEEYLMAFTGRSERDERRYKKPGWTCCQEQDSTRLLRPSWKR